MAAILVNAREIAGAPKKNLGFSPFWALAELCGSCGAQAKGRVAAAVLRCVASAISVLGNKLLRIKYCYRLDRPNNAVV